MKIYILYLLIFLPNLSFSQILDSTIFYSYHETMPKGIAKSYWNYESSLDLEMSEYYIMDIDRGGFTQINTQIFRYLPGTKIHSSLVTIDYPGQYVDSTAYIYNDDTVNIATIKFRKSIQGSEYSLFKEIIHKDLDKTNRKTTEEIHSYKYGIKTNSVVYTYEYAYNNQNELINRIKYKVLSPKQKEPVEKLVQVYNEDRKISEATTYYYNSLMGKWEKIRSYEFEYEKNYEKRTGFYFNRSSGEKNLTKIREIFMLDGSNQVKEMRLFMMEGEQKKLRNENFYFYSG